MTVASTVGKNTQISATKFRFRDFLPYEIHVLGRDATTRFSGKWDRTLKSIPNFCGFSHYFY